MMCRAATLILINHYIQCNSHFYFLMMNLYWLGLGVCLPLYVPKSFLFQFSLRGAFNVTFSTRWCTLNSYQQQCHCFTLEGALPTFIYVMKAIFHHP